MKFSVVALAALAPLAIAAPSKRNWGNCVSQSEAELLVSRYAAVISTSPSDLGGPVRTARAIAAQGYVEQSDSANILGGLPLGEPTVSGKRNWIFESQNNPPFPTSTEEVIAACDKLTDVRFEFNSFAAALDTGYTIFYANGTRYGV
ncbi:hypothetical protein LTR09_012516 [Extremus antarcticus]|uniref:NTF2-like domain-containing protein n=1 Tax=Extremus antarcticus TaxID=702011 RepID=A0AAJ0D4U6_9PEZI|nr:hypothetical protein LTR09_012516 [Extremus antarcticus]